MIGWLIAGLITAVALPDMLADEKSGSGGDDTGTDPDDPAADPAARIDASVLYPDDDPEEGPAPPPQAGETAVAPLLPVRDPEPYPADASEPPETTARPDATDTGGDGTCDGDGQEEPKAEARWESQPAADPGFWHAPRQR